MFRNKLFFEDCCVLMIYLYIQHTYISSYLIHPIHARPIPSYIPAYPILSFSIPVYPIQSYYIPAYPILSYPYQAFPIPSYPVPACLIPPSYAILTCPIQSYSAPTYLIPSYNYPRLSYSVIYYPKSILFRPILFYAVLIIPYSSKCAYQARPVAIKYVLL